MTPSTKTALSALAGLGGLVIAAITFGNGAALALDGTGRYALLVQLAFLTALLSLANGIGLLVAAVQFARNSLEVAQWARWLAVGQLIWLVSALIIGRYAELRSAFYFLLGPAGLVTVLLWLVLRQRDR